MLPMQSVELAIDEIRYSRETLGMRGGFLRPNPYHGNKMAMRGDDEIYGSLFSYIALEDRVGTDHSLRPIREIANRPWRRCRATSLLCIRGWGGRRRCRKNCCGGCCCKPSIRAIGAAADGADRV